MAAVSGRNFTIDPRVTGRVTVVSSRPLSMDAVYEAFLAVLEVNGCTAVTTGEITRSLEQSEPGRVESFRQAIPE